MRGGQGGESYVAMPRWMGMGAIALSVIVALIAVAGLVALGGRIGAVEGRAASTARSVGDMEEDLSAKIDRLADRVDSARTDLAVIGKLGARITNLADDLAAHRREDGSEALAASLARLESSVNSLKGDVVDAMRLAAKAAEARAAPSEPAAPSVTTGDLDRIADRVAGIEERVEELGKARARTSSTSSRTRVNEDAVKKLVEDTVKEQVEAEFKAMRERFRGRRPDGGGGN
jgi:DNA repair exonuclease SbcCD ATPase subunit